MPPLKRLERGMTKARKRCCHDTPGAWILRNGGTMYHVSKIIVKDCPHCPKRKKAANEE